MAITTGVFLDFDGVLCNSLRECFVSSWIAFHDRYRGDKPKTIDRRDYERFRELRPYIRNGKDYVLIQELIADGLTAGSQQEFVRLTRRAGEEKMGTYDSLLYQVRKSMVAAEPEFWLGLHRPFGELVPGLRLASELGSFWIVSTKHPVYIRRILLAWGVTWRADRIVHPVGESKLDVTHRLMSENRYGAAILVGDQPDHLRCSDPVEVDCWFANWAHGLELPHDITARHVDLPELEDLLLSAHSD